MGKWSDPEYRRKYYRDYYWANRDRFRRYHQASESSVRTRSRQNLYTQNHPARVKEAQVKYRRSLKYKIKELKRQFEELDSQRELLENSLALLREHPFCDVCGTSLDLRIHHRVPISQGGTHNKENLMVLCEKHHWAKGSGIHWRGEEVNSASKQLILIDSRQA